MRNETNNKHIWYVSCRDIALMAYSLRETNISGFISNNFQLWKHVFFFYLSQYTGFIIWSVSPFTFSQILQSQARFRHEMLTTFLAYFSDVLFKFVAIWTTNTSQRTCHHCACCLIRRFFLFCFPFIRLRLLHGLRPCIISLQLN